MRKAIAKFVLHSGTVKQVDLKLPMNPKYKHDLGLYRDGLDTILANVQQQPGQDLFCSL